MRRGESSNILFSLLLFLFIGEVQQAACSSCGDIKNIRYPFRLKVHPAEFGHSVFELTCQSNKPILQYLSGKYYVKEISYDYQIIKVVDVNLTNGGFGALPSQPLSFSKTSTVHDNRTGFEFGLKGSWGIGGHLKTYTEAQFLNCSSNFSHPLYTRVPCLSGNRCHVYVYYNTSSITTDRQDSCSFLSSIPMLRPIQTNLSYEAIQHFLQLGFELKWDNVDCFQNEIFYRSGLIGDTINFYCSKSTADPDLSMWQYYTIDALVASFLWGN
ncbi:hypothetical protein Pint_22143 [Pistacia integerrima]|uniref:Uncharacterized protein n=1 Tax=Pistacia integerrima TaxID=434235 RepID=A0ACC0YL40_9ROSI|nr:hypothetical protein Pint_22143 [Pistacia integerrima]